MPRGWRHTPASRVFGWFDEAPLVEPPAVGEGLPVAETGEVERPDVHDRLESVELVVGRLDVSAVGVDGSVDPLLVRPAWVPRTRAPDQVGEVGQTRSAPGRLPVARRPSGRPGPSSAERSSLLVVPAFTKSTSSRRCTGGRRRAANRAGSLMSSCATVMRPPARSARSCTVFVRSGRGPDRRHPSLCRGARPRSRGRGHGTPRRRGPSMSLVGRPAFEIGWPESLRRESDERTAGGIDQEQEGEVPGA